MQTQNPDPLTAQWKHALSNLGQDKVEWKKGQNERTGHKKSFEKMQLAKNSEKVQ